MSLETPIRWYPDYPSSTWEPHSPPGSMQLPDSQLPP